MPELATLRLRRLAAGLCLAAIGVAAELGHVSAPMVESLDRYLYDARMRMQPVRPNSRILIVDVDERSLRDEGRWPWPRDRIARLVELIARQGGARAVGFDMVFAEPEPEHDPVLARALDGAPVALGYYFASELGAISSGQLPAPVFATSALRSQGIAVTAWHGYGANVAQVQQSARTAGFFNSMVDRDGVVRALPLLADHRGHLYESLAVSLLRLHFDGAPLALRTGGMAGDALAFGPRGDQALLPISHGATALVPFQGRGGARASRFRYVSASDVLAGRVDTRVFDGRIVLVGTSAPGLTDLRATPVSEVYPGVEIHASLIAGALEGTVKMRPADAPSLGALVVGAVGALAAVAMAMSGAVGIAAAALASLSLLYAWNAIASSQLGWVLPLASGLLVVIAMAAVNLVTGYVVEGRSRRAVIALFGQYLAPQLVARMAGDPANRPLESQNKELTILFADIRGFTRMAENMEPQQLRDYLNRFLTAMTEVIHAHGGTVDKYIGDAVMAFWGAPVDDPEHADHAVAAALAMQRAVERLNVEFGTLGWPRLAIGIGINTGVVRVGDMGSRIRRAYTAIGDAVNLASRLETLSKQLGLPIVVGEATRNAVSGISLRFVGNTIVPGRSEPVGVFRPMLPGESDGPLPLAKLIPLEAKGPEPAAVEVAGASAARSSQPDERTPQESLA